jgi:hypothetical protein
MYQEKDIEQMNEANKNRYGDNESPQYVVGIRGCL